MDEELLHMLGYLTEEKWKDAFSIPELNKERLREILEEVDRRYDMTMAKDIFVEGI